MQEDVDLFKNLSELVFSIKDSHKHINLALMAVEKMISNEVSLEFKFNKHNISFTPRDEVKNLFCVNKELGEKIKELNSEGNIGYLDVIIVDRLHNAGTNFSKYSYIENTFKITIYISTVIHLSSMSKTSVRVSVDSDRECRYVVPTSHIEINGCDFDQDILEELREKYRDLNVIRDTDPTYINIFKNLYKRECELFLSNTVSNTWDGLINAFKDTVSGYKKITKKEWRRRKSLKKTKKET